MFRVKMVSVFFSPFLQFCRNHLSEWHLWHQETKQIDFYSTKTIVNSIWWFSCPRCWQTLLAPSQRAPEVTRTGEKDELVESESEENNCCNCHSKTKVWREQTLQGADPRTRGAWASDQVDRKHQSRCRVHRNAWTLTLQWDGSGLLVNVAAAIGQMAEDTSSLEQVSLLLF